MRARRTAQTSLFEPRAVDHPVADDLQRASDWLDDHPELLELVAADVGGDATTGRHGLTCETILRCAVLKHLWRHSYRELEFLLRDSASAQRFARVEAHRAPGKTALQAAVAVVGAATWERIGAVLLDSARTGGVEDGRRVRVDSTVTETHILAPADSRLLYDVVRVLTRLLGEARGRLGPEAVAFRDHGRAAKRRALEIRSARGADRRAELYRRLLGLVRRTRGYAEAARPAVAAVRAPWARSWTAAVDELDELAARVVDQTRRRVFDGETVPAGEKVASLFEPHTDVIRKGGRRTHYGHKINLTTGRSGLVLDAVVEDGNPADSERCLPMLERHVARYGAAPSHAAFDGGYATKANLADAKALGVAHAVFHKKRGLRAGDMTPSAWVYARLRRFRAGVEAGISYLKRCFGLGRCNWRGLGRFKAYVLSAVFAHNLMRLVRLRPG